MSFEADSPEARRLMAAAEKARIMAYAPYSGFCVGAALLFKGGETVTGCNVENASLGLSICAERNAMTTAIARGLREPEAIAIAGPDGVFCSPCGACRQFLVEFNPDMAVLVKSPKEPKLFTLRELLPADFSLEEENNG